jgi:outer membrane immunogenic protein
MMLERALILSAVTATLGLATPALAQTEGSPWNGWYVGAHAGVTWGDTKTNLHLEQGTGAPIIPPADFAGLNALATSSHNRTGFTGGIEGGYNYQMGQLLIGVETDFGFLDTKKTNSNTYQSKVLISPPITYTLTNRAKSDWMWTLRPRIGYIYGDWLFFGSAGIAVSDIKITTTYADTFTPPNSASMSNSSTKTGFAGGLGVGYAFNPNWSFKGEWLYTDFGKVSAATATPSGVAVIKSEAKVKANLVRFGVDYRF